MPTAIIFCSILKTVPRLSVSPGVIIRRSWQHLFLHNFRHDGHNGFPSGYSAGNHHRIAVLRLPQQKHRLWPYSPLLTIAIELGIALLFGLREKRLFSFIAVVNVVTQILLNIALNLAGYTSGPMAFMGTYILLESLIFVLEALLYIWFANRQSSGTFISKTRLILYALSPMAFLLVQASACHTCCQSCFDQKGGFLKRKSPLPQRSKYPPV